MSLADMSRAVAEIQADLRRGHKKRGDSSKSSARRGHKGRSGRHRGHGSRRKSSSHSSRGSSRSSSSRRRRRHRRSSSSGSGSYLQWRAKGHSRAVSPGKLQRFAAKKFRDQPDVIAFAATHPGALSGFFLAMVHQRVSQGLIRESRQLRGHSVVDWVQRCSGLVELRDTREAQTLAMAMDAINQNQLATCMDVLAQRIQALQAAKQKGGSWEKAAKIELAVPQAALAGSSGLLRLVQ